MRSEQEHNIQVACVTWFRYQFPHLVCFAVPNGSKRPKKTVRTKTGAIATYSPAAVKLKEEGALAGVADLVLVGMGKVVFVEMKTPKGTQQDTQKEFLADMAAAGHFVATCYSAEEAIKVIEEYLNLSDAVHMERNLNMSIPNNSILKNGEIKESKPRKK